MAADGSDAKSEAEDKIRALVGEVEQEFTSLLRAKCPRFYPGVCGLASHMLLAYLQVRLAAEPSVAAARVCDGTFDGSGGNRAGCMLHAWIEVGGLIVDATFEQYHTEYAGRVRIMPASATELTGYVAESRVPAGARYVERAKNARTLAEFIAQFEN